MKTEKRYTNDLELHLKQVWMLPNINDKRLVALDLVNNMQFKGKADSFISAINKARTAAKIDEICTNIVMAGEGFGSSKPKFKN